MTKTIEELQKNVDDAYEAYYKAVVELEYYLGFNNEK
jgi:hypothetical protein